ncbi:heavy metal translocating P-type ATPase [Clostridiaceae bacterium OttesenSCG-928-D20]|nr:heavy metal translocating P-type ATPase [Clostridiaceae bacterium OttesenSCG-928-D20]
MQKAMRFVLKRKNKIALLGGILIIIAFTGEFLAKRFSNLHESLHVLVLVSLISASVLGALPIAIQAYQSLRLRLVTIDVLVTIAIIGAFIIQNYEEAAVVSFLFLFGAFLEQKTLSQTRSAIKKLTEMAPETALKQRDDGEFEEVFIDEVDIGDVLLVKTGAKIPVDGVVLSGEGYANEASITGEPLARGKSEGAMVYAGTILENGTLIISASRVGEDTTFGKIIELVEEAQDAKSSAERFIDRFAKHYTPAVLVFSLIVGLISRSLELAITILVLGCPGALVIGVPISNVSGIGNGAKNGILLKGSETIHDFSRIDCMVFDKTGTLTLGRPRVSKVFHYTDDIDGALSLLYSVEKQSDHPLARAICEHLDGVPAKEVSSTNVIRGFGIEASIEDETVLVGNLALMESRNQKICPSVYSDIKKLEEDGGSIVLLSVTGRVSALLGIEDGLRPGVEENLKRLRKMGVSSLILLSGDNQSAVDSVAAKLGLDAALGNMLPEDKSEYIKALKKDGKKVAFVGDGVNDSPSLALADIGISMGSGTDVAIETSDVVLISDDFSKLAHAYGLARITALNMRENIFIAIAVVLFLLLSLFFSSWMNMSIGMLVHEGSILLVTLNGMRLLGYKTKK